MNARTWVLLLIPTVASCTDILAPSVEAPSLPDPYLAPAAAANRSTPVRATMFGAFNVGCEGATDLANPRGAVHVRVVRDGLRFTVNLKGAEPDASYTVTAFTSAQCPSGAAFNSAIATDEDGNGSFAGHFPLASGTYQVLITAHTGFGVADPANRDIGNVLFSVTIP